MAGESSLHVVLMIDVTVRQRGKRKSSHGTVRVWPCEGHTLAQLQSSRLRSPRRYSAA